MNKLNQNLCEACEKKSWTIIEDADCASVPYYLCTGCHKRLQLLSLRPKEWYNLAIIHGWKKYYLHDGFYDENGVANQPREQFHYVIQEDHAPLLQEVINDLPRLVEYCTTKWWIDEQLIENLMKYPKKDILAICEQKYSLAKVHQIKSALIRIASYAAGSDSASWIKQLWTDNDIDMISLSQASIKALPLGEAFCLITHYLKTVPPRELPNTAWSCLYLCKSANVLDWMEQVVKEYNDSWANLAAVSNPTWAYMHKWISTGRPLSLIAIETLSNCIPCTNDPFLASLNPSIRDAPQYDTIEQFLLDYEKLDNVPRVNKAIARIRKHADQLFNSPPS